MTRPTTESLVKALATGDPVAFGALYDRFGRSMVRVATTMLGSSEAEDAMQDVFVEIARRRDQMHRVQNLDAYVFAILRNNVKHRLHARKKEQDQLRELPLRTQPSEAPDRNDLNAAIARLPDEQREVITLKIDGGLTFAEIAEVLRISPNTAASRYRYALEKLRTMLE